VHRKPNAYLPPIYCISVEFLRACHPAVFDQHIASHQKVIKQLARQWTGNQMLVECHFRVPWMSRDCTDIKLLSECRRLSPQYYWFLSACNNCSLLWLLAHLNWICCTCRHIRHHLIDCLPFTIEIIISRYYYYRFLSARDCCSLLSCLWLLAHLNWIWRYTCR
jgi:hypothetical protein